MLDAPAVVAAADVDMRSGIDIDVGEIKEEFQHPPIIEVKMELERGATEIRLGGRLRREAPPCPCRDQLGFATEIVPCHVEKQGVPLHRQGAVTLQHPIEMVAAQDRAAEAPLGVCVLAGEKLNLAIEVAETRRFAPEPSDFLMNRCGSVRPVAIPVLLSSAATASARRSPNIEGAALGVDRTGLAVSQWALRNGIVRASRNIGSQAGFSRTSVR
jgi:hypothetical protein